MYVYKILETMGLSIIYFGIFISQFFKQIFFGMLFLTILKFILRPKKNITPYKYYKR